MKEWPVDTCQAIFLWSSGFLWNIFYFWRYGFGSSFNNYRSPFHEGTASWNRSSQFFSCDLKCCFSLNIFNLWGGKGGTVMGPSPSEQFSVSFPSVSKLSNNRRFTFHKKDGTLEIEGFSRSIASQQICFIYVTGFLLSNVATIKAKIVQVTMVVMLRNQLPLLLRWPQSGTTWAVLLRGEFRATKHDIFK